MKLRTIIETEGVDTLLSQKEKNLILTNSSDFVMHANSERPLYRGRMTPPKAPVALVQIRQDRMPVDSPAIGTLLYNEQAKRKYGIDGVRNRSAFVSTRIEVAKRYGSPQWVFPTNRTQIFYIPDVVDSYSLLTRLTHMFVKFAEAVIKFDVRKIFGVLEHFIQAHHYRVTLEDVIDEMSHYTNITPEQSGQLKTEVYKFLDGHVNIQKTTPENIGTAGTGGSELLLYGTEFVAVNPQYLKYPIHYDMFIDYLKR